MRNAGAGCRPGPIHLTAGGAGGDAWLATGAGAVVGGARLVWPGPAGEATWPCCWVARRDQAAVVALAACQEAPGYPQGQIRVAWTFSRPGSTPVLVRLGVICIPAMGPARAAAFWFDGRRHRALLEGIAHYGRLVILARNPAWWWRLAPSGGVRGPAVIVDRALGAAGIAAVLRSLGASP